MECINFGEQGAVENPVYTYTFTLSLNFHVVIKQSVVGGEYLSVADWHPKHTSTISHLGIYGNVK